MNTGVALLLVAAATLFLPMAASAAPEVRNGSFEKLTKEGRPEVWGTAAWGREGLDAKEVCTVVEMPDAPAGRCVAQIVPKGAHYCSWVQGLVGLEPGQWYEVSAMVRCEDLQGQGCFLNLEYWRGSVGFGCVDSEHLVGTVGWTRAVVRFQAPGPDTGCNVSLFQIGGPGKVWFDDVRLRPIAKPDFDLSARRVLDAPFWGMFTCYANYLHQYGKEMKDAGVYWQRQGGAACHRDQQGAAERLGMGFQMCLDGMPGPADPKDPCHPITSSPAYLDYLRPYLEGAGPTIRAWEVFNEPNNNLAWTLPAYTNLLKLVGKAVKERHPTALFATGGFAVPEVGYLEAVLKRGAKDVLDLALLHPYAVDEALDSALYAVGEACRAGGRPDLAVAINETGFPTWDPATGCTSYEQFFSEADQASNVVKLHVQALAHRLSFVTYLGWNDFTEPSDHARNMGLIRVDGSPKPSYHAYLFLTRTLGPRPRLEWSYGADGTRTYVTEGEKPVRILWNALRKATATVDVGTQKVFPCDLYGARLTRTPVTGKVTVDVGPAPLYLAPAE